MQRTGQIALVLLLLGSGLNSACSMPYSSTRTVNDNPALVIANAPAGALLFVDGISVGPAIAYSGENALSILPGQHVIEVRDGQRLLLREEIYLSGNATKTLFLPAMP